MTENHPPPKHAGLDAARMSLISPPPEEELQHVFGKTHNTANTKRKRQTPSKAPAEATPNPKPRKSNRRPADEDSPTRNRSPLPNNPNADWLPPRAHSQRRSVTPYEPPTDVFTSPREVFLRVPGPTSTRSKRRTPSVQPATPLRVLLHSIKKEMPPIDLSRPMTPPSPTDDPLLLSPTPLASSSSPCRRFVPLPDNDDRHTTDSMDLDISESFDEPQPGAGGSDFSDSDSEGELPNNPTAAHVTPPRRVDSAVRTPPRRCQYSPQEEDFVTNSTVRTKPDPPTPNTAARAAAWGVWGSPYPGRGPEGEGGSFRMDGRRRTSGESNSLVARGAFDFDFSTRDDEDEPLEEGVSILRALREEDEQRAMAMNLDLEQDEEEEEVRSMSVEAEEEHDQHPVHAPTPRQSTGLQAPWLQETTHVQTPPTRRTPIIPPRTERLRSPFEDEDIRMGDADDHILTAVGTRNPSTPSPIKSRHLGTPSSGLYTAPFPRDSPFVPADPDRDLRDGQVDSSAEDAEDSDDNSSILGLVKITSTDPRAAARAAAILKQHDYDCFTRLQRRHSFSGIGKGKTPASPAQPRKSLGGLQDINELRRRAKERQKHRKGQEKERAQTPRVVGERVYFPGSPQPVTTAQLLAEAEEEVSLSGIGRSPSRDEMASTRMPALRVDQEEPAEEDEQDWTKNDWKRLDACFTDERIELASRSGMKPRPSTPSFQTPVRRPTEAAVMMAAADAVDIDAVVARYVDLYGDKWDTAALTQRVRALQNKQRAGHVAPPTPKQILHASSPLMREVTGFSGRRASMNMPTLTPLGRPTRPSRAHLPPPLTAGAPFSALPPTPEPARRRRVPGSLFAPRYSHLLEEAVAVSGSGTPAKEPEANTAYQDFPTDEQEQTDSEGHGSDDSEQQASFDSEQQDASFASSSASNEDPDAEMAPTTPLREHEAQLAAAPPAMITKRVKGFLFSYLPTLSKTARPPARTKLPTGPRLPVPPAELLEKRRGPVTTPVRPPLPKARAPKELVTLQPAPQLAKKPTVARRAPQRLVELNHITPPKEEPVVRQGPRPRTGSGGSVKDMVRNFEALDNARTVAKEAEVKRVRSVGDLGKRAGAGRPIWRP
ncbi:hypothetical protein FB45DRAFT_907997 [Roridomyces roridus]|uniref:Uncharacterized protein n=1 Tax=Roridomyces roridus TaxID=1738132 RepID=A0AAD7C288_9AGAR|nr:hypothetical protein FB45DRAFT_907997 [Roridomyces roridus]